MKVRKTVWLVLGIAIFIIAAVILNMMNSRQLSEQEQLNTSLSAAQGNLTTLVTKKQDLASQLAELESRLDQATSLLNETKASFRVPVESIEYDEMLFRLAFESGLRVRSLTASEPLDQTESEVTYSVTSFVIDVMGVEPLVKTGEEFQNYIDNTVANILIFVNAIARGDEFTTATIESVDIIVPEPLTDEEVEKRIEEEAEFDMPLATIELIIYSYEGK